MEETPSIQSRRALFIIHFICLSFPFIFLDRASILVLRTLDGNGLDWLMGWYCVLRTIDLTHISPSTNPIHEFPNKKIRQK